MAEIVTMPKLGFDMAEGTTYGDPVCTQVTRMLTTEPLWPPAIQRLPTACVT